ATDLDSLRAKVLGGLQRLLHRATERHAALKLQRDIFRHELGIQFRRLDFQDVDVNFLAGHFAQFFLELVDFRTLATDDHARPGRQNRDAATRGRALDQNLRDRSGLELLLQQPAYLAVLGQQLAEFLLAGVPLGAPVTIDCNAKPDWIGLLAHNNYSSDKTIL